MAQKNVSFYAGVLATLKLRFFLIKSVILYFQAKASVQDLLQFRQAVTFMNETHPFSRAFGLVRKRDNAVITFSN